MNHALTSLLLIFAVADPSHLLQEAGPAKLLTAAPLTDGNLVLRFSDYLVLTVRVEGDAGLEVEPPEKWTQSPGWRGKSLGNPTIKALDKGRIAWEQSISLDPLAPGDQPIELHSVRYRHGRNRWQTAEWRPFSVKVTSQIKEPDAKNLRERTPTEDPEATPPSPSYAWLYVAIAAVLVIAGATFLLWRRREKIKVRRSPTELALYELDRLLAMRLPDQGKSEEFHTLLANIVRRFLEKKYQIPARRQTTHEFLASLDQSTLSAQQRAFMGDFLKRCDLAKFAGAQVSPADADALLRETRAFLQS